MDFLVAVSKDERIGLKETGFGVNKQGRERGTARRKDTVPFGPQGEYLHITLCVHKEIWSHH